MSIVMQLQDVAESTRLGPLSGEVRAGEILHLVGPNGAGKSTLLARMAGMTSGKGSIQFAGQPLEAWSATKLALHRAYLSLLCEDGTHRLIRRAETPRDYFATLDFLPLMKPLFED